VLENLVEGRAVNRIAADDATAERAKVALARMLPITCRRISRPTGGAAFTGALARHCEGGSRAAAAACPDACTEPAAILDALAAVAVDRRRNGARRGPPGWRNSVSRPS
jgi:hypothetical protein